MRLLIFSRVRVRGGMMGILAILTILADDYFTKISSVNEERTYGRPDEELGVPELDVGELQVPQQHHDGVLVAGAAEVGPGVLREHLVALQEAVVALPRREPRPAHAHVLHQPQVGHLVPHLPYADRCKTTISHALY